MPLTADANMPRVIQNLRLPHFGESAPGPLHTIVTDPDGNIYYSDEINNSVVSLSSDGSVRWHRTKRGKAPGEFWYPKGLSLGYLQIDGKTVQCLAIADAWNRRVQFLSLAGNLICEWTRAGESEFVDVADVRYIRIKSSPEGDAEATGYWAILDRGNHRLCALGEDGTYLFQIGHRFPPSMETRWVIPGMLLDGDNQPAGYIRSFPPFDYAFYPERILGNSEDALCLWEPHSQRLKKVILSNLLPIQFGHKGIVWIGVDHFGILGWRPDIHHLLFYNCSGQLQEEFEIFGMPVPTDFRAGEFWLQQSDYIQRCQLEMFKGDENHTQAAGLHWLLRHSAEAEICLIDRGRIQKGIDDCIAVADEEIALAERLGMIGKDINSQELLDVSAQLCRLPERRRRVERSLYETLHHWCLGLLEYRLTEIGEHFRSEKIECAGDQLNLLSVVIKQTFARIQGCLDDLLTWRILFLEAQNEDKDSIDRWTEIALKTEADLQVHLDWIYHWSNVVEATEEFVSLPGKFGWKEAFEGTDKPAGFLIDAGTSRKAVIGSTPCLREIGRISLGPGNSLAPVALTCFSREDLFVCAFLGHQILRLNNKGVIVERIGKFGTGPGELQGPADIALDPKDRLWVADYKNHRIQMYDIKQHTVKIVGSYGSGLGQFNSPCRICARPDGSMLVMDGGNHRIMRIKEDGFCEIFYKRIGRGSGELLDPLSLFSGSEGIIWVADRRNHHLIGLDDEGTCVREIGKCGFGTGELYFPEYITGFDGGVLAVIQNQYNRCIKLFTSEGFELGKLPLNYYALGMTTYQRRLFVSDMKGDCIRVYERDNV